MDREDEHVVQTRTHDIIKTRCHLSMVTATVGAWPLECIIILYTMATVTVFHRTYFRSRPSRREVGRTTTSRLRSVHRNKVGAALCVVDSWKIRMKSTFA